MVSIDNLSSEYNIFLVRSGATGVRKRNNEIISALTEMGYHIIIVTTNVPSEIQMKNYEKTGIDTSNLFFIDMVTPQAIGKRMEDTEQVNFIDRPGDLTKAGILITNIMKGIQDEKIAFVFDTINTMLIYSNKVSVSRFVHFIINKIRIQGIQGYFIMVDKSLDTDLVSEFEMLTDISIPRDEQITLIKSEITKKIELPEDSYEESDLK